MPLLMKPASRLLAFCLVALCVSGCITGTQDSARYSGYQPDMSGRNIYQDSSGGNGGAVRDVPDNESSPVPVAGQQLKKGDKIVVYLRGIPVPEEVPNIINTLGEITLPHLSPVKVAGMAPEAAERMIEKRYIDGGIYRIITVIIVAEEGEYFVRGEVKSPGRYTLSGDRTLTQAIATAGGYTLYANPSKITIHRGSRTIKADARAIEKGKAEDPLIESGDVIIVKKRFV